MHLLWTGLGGGTSAGSVTRGLLSLLAASTAAAGVLAWRWRAERGRLQAQLDEAHSQEQANLTLLRLVFDNAPSSFVVVDDHRRIVRANRTAERVHALPIAEDDCGLELEDPVRCTICPGCQTLKTGAPGAASRDHTDPRTGEMLRIETYPLELPDGRIFALMVERVVTEQRKLEARLLHQEKMAAFGLIAAGVAHEMGNPLSSIDMHLQLLDAAPGLTQPHRASVRTLRQQTARLARTVRELVDFSRRRRDEPGLVAVRSVIEDTLRLVRYDPRFQGIQTKLEIDANTPAVRFIEDHLVQVILNLVLNALDAMANSGTLAFEVRPIGEQVVIHVRDNGAGMPHETLDRCFEPLFTTKPAGQGTGLGLSICRDLVRRAGGEIELHSASGTGTTAIVTLPAVILAAVGEAESPMMKASA